MYNERIKKAAFDFDEKKNLHKTQVKLHCCNRWSFL